MAARRRKLIKTIFEILDYEYNDMYLGSMAKAKIYHILGLEYGINTNLKKEIKDATLKDLTSIYNFLEKQGWMETLKNNPIKNCPHCGQTMLKR